MPMPAVAPGARELTSEARRLRMEVEALQRQRDTLEQETSRLQHRAEVMESQPRGNNAQRGAMLLETKFEAALQAIGRLQEELEVCQSQRDEYKKLLGRAPA